MDSATLTTAHQPHQLVSTCCFFFYSAFWVDFFLLSCNNEVGVKPWQHLQEKCISYKQTKTTCTKISFEHMSLLKLLCIFVHVRYLDVRTIMYPMYYLEE